MKVLIVLLPWIKASYLHHACIVTKLRQSINANLDKINYSYNATILWVFLLISILNQSYYHQTHIADQLTYIIVRHSWSYILLSSSYQFFLSLLSFVFSLLHDKHFETNEKISCSIHESVTHFYPILENNPSTAMISWQEWWLFIYLFHLYFTSVETISQ